MKHTFIFSLAVVLVLLLFLANLFYGSVAIPATDVWEVLMGHTADDASRFIVLHSRLPQAIVALLSGSALAVTGLLLQTYFANPLADASILGVHSGAGLGAALVLLLLGGSLAAVQLPVFVLLMMASLLGALCIMLLLMAFASMVRSHTLLLIVGIMLSYVVSACISLLGYLSTADNLQSFFMWGMGSFGNVSLSQLAPFSVAVMTGLCVSWLLVKPLNAWQMGEHYAQNLGISPKRVKLGILLVVGWLSAVVTACCGPIAFVGLAVPHISRVVLRTTNHLYLLPSSMLLGAAVALLCQLLSSLIVESMLIPVNVITPFFGVPVILYVLVNRRVRVI